MTGTMSPSNTGAPNRWAKLIQDMIADSANLREGLTDDEAMPLIDWGANRAIQLGDRLAQPDQAELTDEQVGDIGYTLVRLMTRIAWLVVYRNEKDAEWLTRTFNNINELSQELDGVHAAELSDDEITAWIGQHTQFANSQLIHDLITRLTPKPPAAPTPPPKPDGPTLLSSILDTDGTIKPPDSPPSSQGDQPNDQEKNL